MSGCRVLLADDDNDIRQGASLRLKAQGYEPILASVLDVRMPRMDGYSALVQLKQNSETKRIPVIMMSASIGDRQAALDAGARFFLDKPYHGKTLLAAVETAIAESHPNLKSPSK